MGGEPGTKAMNGTHDNCEGNIIVTKYLEVTLASHSVTLVFLPFDTGGLVTGNWSH